ncbi:MAG: PAS domain S-box protein [Bacteroidia bacterium]|nr:PAS domain S-box protein [Bacteroidia bacterium]
MKPDITYFDYLTDASKSSKFIYMIMESFPQGIVISDQEDRIIYANHKMAQLTGYSRKEMLGKITHHFFHFPDQQSQLKELADSRLAGTYETYELYVRRCSGAPFMAHIITAPYKNLEGNIIGTISIVTDITITKRQAELEALAIAATKSLNSVIITDKHSKIEWVNEGFKRLSGYSLHEVIDTYGEVLRRGHNEYFSSKFAEAVLEKKPVACFYTNFSKSGETYVVKSTITPVLDINGDVKEVIIVETDIGGDTV